MMARAMRTVRKALETSIGSRLPSKSPPWLATVLLDLGLGWPISLLHASPRFLGEQSCGMGWSWRLVVPTGTGNPSPSVIADLPCSGHSSQDGWGVTRE